MVNKHRIYSNDNSIDHELEYQQPGGNKTIIEEIINELRCLQASLKELLPVVETENQKLRELSCSPSEEVISIEPRKRILPLLSSAVARIKQLRQHAAVSYQQNIKQNPDIQNLILECQNIIMRIMILDRENEQNLLRLGRVPVCRIPPVAHQQSNYVSNLYRRNAGNY